MAVTVFCDTETTGVSYDSEIWEFAAVRRDDEGNRITFHAFVQHDLAKAAKLPESFRADHDARYDPSVAVTPREFANILQTVFRGRPRVVGAVPNFDTERFGRLLRHFGHDDHPWHHRLRDVETMAESYLRGRAALGDEAARVAVLNAATDPDALSRACGVEPPGEGVRHTAMGDVEWAMALYDAVMNGPEANVWIVPKVSHDQNRTVGPVLRRNGWIHRSEGTSEPDHTRYYAALLLAAADESERMEVPA